MASTVLIAIPTALLLLLGYYVVPLLWRSMFSPLRHLPGPPTPSLFWGQFKVIAAEDNSVPQERWVAQYGSNVAYQGIFRVRSWFHTGLIYSRFNTHDSPIGVASLDRRY